VRRLMELQLFAPSALQFAEALPYPV